MKIQRAKWTIVKDDKTTNTLTTSKDAIMHLSKKSFERPCV